MKKLSILLFAFINAIIFNSCTKEDTKNDSSQIVDPNEIKDNVLVKKIT